MNLLSLIASLFGRRRSVESILSGITSMVKELERSSSMAVAKAAKVEKKRLLEVETHAKLVEEAERKHKAALEQHDESLTHLTAEQTRAAAVMANLKNLVSVPAVDVPPAPVEG